MTMYCAVSFKCSPSPDALGCIEIVSHPHIRSIHSACLAKLLDVLKDPTGKQVVIIGNVFSQAALMASYMCTHYECPSMLTDPTGLSDIEQTFRKIYEGVSFTFIPALNVDNYINGAASRASRITQAVTNFMKSRGCQDADLVLVADACANVADWKTALAGVYQERCVVA